MRFFFDIRDGDTLIEDPDGEEFSGVEAAQAEAIQAARELMAQDLLAGKPLDGRSFEICDDRRTLLRIVPFKQAIPTG